MDSAVRFERTRAFKPPVLQAGAFDHLATPRNDWHRTTGSNREPSALEAAALPIELARLLVPRARIERATSGFVGRRSGSC